MGITKEGTALSITRWIALLFFMGVLGACGESPVEPQPALEITSPAGEGSAQPHLAVGADDSVVLSWLEPEADGYALRFSTFADDRWDQTRTLATGANWFVNWADFPSVVPIDGSLWAAHWLVMQDEGFGYDVVLSLSRDGGVTWEDPSPLHLDGTPTEHGFVTLFPWQDGFAATWLDGRNFIQDGEFAFETSDGEPLGMSLRYALFDGEGERVGTDEIDALACDCCQTDVALIGGDALLVYRDRTTEEVRDIVVRRLSDDDWEQPVGLDADDWVIAGCPINGPAIDARDDNVAVAWFSAVDNRPLVHLALSGDGGHSFGESIEIDSAGSFGHVDVAVLANGESVISWLRTDDAGLALTMRLASRSGELGEPITVATIDAGRPLDFPQMVHDGTRLIFAWTEFAEAEQVRTAVVELAP